MKTEIRNIENMSLHYLPGCKFDTVEEFNDGTMVIHAFEKRFFIYSCLHQGLYYFYNALNGHIYMTDKPGNVPELLNYSRALEFRGMNGIGIINDRFCLYHADRQKLYFFDQDFNPLTQINTNIEAHSCCFSENKIGFYNRNSNVFTEFSFQNDAFTETRKVELKGIGNKSFAVKDNELWVTDSEENMVYVYSYDTLMLKFQIITPYFDPQTLFFFENKPFVIYGGEVNESSYGQRCWQEQKPFIHLLKYSLVEKEGFNYTLSNTMLVDFIYEEHFDHISRKYPELKVSVALPIDNQRQKVVNVEMTGIKGEIKNGRVEYNLKNITEISGGFIGYKAEMLMSSIKYTFTKDYEKTVFAGEEYHVNKEGLDLTNPKFIDMASCSGSGVIKDMLALRNKVFDKLSYRVNNSARNYVELLEDGYGTCGDYATILLILALINDYPVRTCGGYKVPRFGNSQEDLRSCYYNHTWLEMYLKDTGWIPIESSSDDKEFKKRLCEGQFLGLDWSHVQTHNDKTVPNLINAHDGKEEIHPFDLFKNVTFMKVRGELSEF